MFPRRTVKKCTLIITRKLTTTLIILFSDIILLSLGQLYRKHISTHGIQHEFIFICAKCFSAVGMKHYQSKSNINPPQDSKFHFSFQLKHTHTQLSMNSPEHSIIRIIVMDYHPALNKEHAFTHRHTHHAHALPRMMYLLEHKCTRILNSNIIWVESHVPWMRCELKMSPVNSFD